MTRNLATPAAALLLLAATAACTGAQHDADVPGDADDTAPYAGIAEGDVVHFLGTEPFWGGDVTKGTLTWTTPEDMDGQSFPVTRFAGRGGQSYSGALDGQDFTLMLTEADCSDGMSDRTYPFVATVTIGGADALNGCAYTDAQPHSGDPA